MCLASFSPLTHASHVDLRAFARVRRGDRLLAVGVGECVGGRAWAGAVGGGPREASARRLLAVRRVPSVPAAPPAPPPFAAQAQEARAELGRHEVVQDGVHRRVEVRHGAAEAQDVEVALEAQRLQRFLRHRHDPEGKRAERQQAHEEARHHGAQHHHHLATERPVSGARPPTLYSDPSPLTLRPELVGASCNCMNISRIPAAELARAAPRSTARRCAKKNRHLSSRVRRPHFRDRPSPPPGSVATSSPPQPPPALASPSQFTDRQTDTRTDRH
ncbi:Uncharacterized protein GBIM_05859 [Gryllus bimaculatus]|nr:Uncharacterized protein GBIM_05859 [Gryllus bimaculatus]